MCASIKNQSEVCLIRGPACSSDFSLLRYTGWSALMFCKPAVLRQLWRAWVPLHTTLYAFSFWSSSYTLMATVWRISPSQSLGFFLSGLRRCKDCRSLPYYDESRLGLSLGIARSLNAYLSRSKPVSVGFPENGRNSRKIQRTIPASIGFGRSPDSVIGIATPNHFCWPEIEGYDYVGKPLFSS